MQPNVGDSGVYISVTVSDATVENVRQWLAKHTLDATAMNAPHVTILSSPTPVRMSKGASDEPWFELMDHTPKPLQAKASKVVFLEMKDGKTCMALELVCDELKKRHEAALAAGGTCEFKQWKPHLTVVYDVAQALNTAKQQTSAREAHTDVCRDTLMDPLGGLVPNFPIELTVERAATKIAGWKPPASKEPIASVK